MPEPIRVLLVEDDTPVRELLARMLERADRITLLAAVGTLGQAREACATLRPGVLVTDLKLPDGHGLTLIRETRANLPDTQIMVISVLADEASVVAAIRAGAGGYLLKDDLPEDFEAFIRNLAAGHATLSPAIASYIIRGLQPGARAKPAAEAPLPEGALTARELDVLTQIAKGLSYSDIGTRLNISSHTVGSYIKSIYRKLEVNSRGEAVFQAINRNLLML